MSARTNKPSYFGNCPTCNAEPEILNVGRDHFAVCRNHKVYWPIGSNLFSNWHGESPEVWERNKEFLAICTPPPSPRPKRPPMGTLGDCLAETARRQPAGFAKITYATSEHQEYEPDVFDGRKPWLSLDAVTVCMAPAPVTIFIAAGTAVATARVALKQAREFLKEYDSLDEWTPQEPPCPMDDDSDSVPF